MKPDDFEAGMRRLEWFHPLRLPEGAWAVLRLDGRGFSGFTESHCEKPFDPKFHDWMVQTAQALLEEFQGAYAYTESDEISLLLPRGWDLFDRELEKAISLSAGLASSVFSLACGTAVHFDSRAIIAAQDEQAVDYFRWRQADAARCALNGWCYWTLRKQGQSVAEATEALRGKGTADKNELLFQSGVNFNEVPLWQRRGTGLHRETYDREGRDPRGGRKATAARRRVRVDEGLPMGEEYGKFISQILRAGGVAPAAATGDEV
jgi:tRNA(His) guanylyltransferase